MVILTGLSLPLLLWVLVPSTAFLFFGLRSFFNTTNPASEFSPAARPATDSLNDKASKRPGLPKGWWTDTTLFQLERRAIFSQTWICISHRGRFLNPGDYVSYELAGFRFFLILGKDMIIRGFHNVCRHRAFPVAQKESGSSTILGCKYHGWSYDTKGQLTKAPHFDNVSGFDKNQNSLFEIHTKLDKDGFIHVNLSGSPEVGDSELLDAKTIGKPDRINVDSQFICNWEFKGKFNWKMTVNDRFQCGIERSRTALEVLKSSIFRFFSTRQDLTSMDRLCYFPITIVHTKVGSPFWYQVTYSPDSTQQTTLRCEVYAIKQSNSLQLEDTAESSLKNHTLSMIKYYERRYDELVSSKYDQDYHEYGLARISKAVQIHQEKERIEEKAISPAAVRQCRSAAFAQAEGLYRKVECGSDKLDW